MYNRANESAWCVLFARGSLINSWLAKPLFYFLSAVKKTNVCVNLLYITSCFIAVFLSLPKSFPFI